MPLTRLLFALCLLGFVAKQLGYVVSTIHENTCIELAFLDSDIQEKQENSDNQPQDDFYSLFLNAGSINVFHLIYSDSFIPNTALIYSEFLLGIVSPPPDSM